MVERRAKWVETWHNIERRRQQPVSLNIYDHVEGHYNRRARRERVYVSKPKTRRRGKRPDNPAVLAMDTRCQDPENADDESTPVMDGYRKAIVQGWTPITDLHEAHKEDGRVRVGEEDPRCSAHSDRRIAVAINLNERQTVD